MASDDLIDVHSHHYPNAYLDACRRADSGLEHYVRDDGRIVVLQDGAVALAVPQPLPTLAERLALMDDAGVELQVLSISAPNIFRLPDYVRVPLAREVNEELNELGRTSEGRLLTFASLPLPDVDAALEELELALALDHVVGVILCTTIDRRPLDDPVFAPLLEELSRREAVVFVHPTTGCCTEGVREYALALALDFLAETTNCLGRLVYSGTIDRYPGIRWIFTHLGGTTPFVIHRFDNYATQFPECGSKIERKPSEILRAVTFDTVTTHVPALKCALSTFGPERFVFGTDYPHVPGGLQAFVQTLDAAGLNDSERAAIGRETARSLLRLG
jgi:predicted TIM-barrel fold metal-dependent hydrolase